MFLEWHGAFSDCDVSFHAYGAECEWWLLVRSLSFCTLSSEQLYHVRFYCLWCRMRVTAFCQIFEFLHPFQWTHIKQQILCSLNDMVLSMTVMWDFIAYGAECEWRLLVRSLSFCTLSSEHILSSRFCITWMTNCTQMVLSMTVAIAF